MIARAIGIFLVSLAVIITPASASEPTRIPDDVRWKENLNRFFFVNTGDTTAFYHAFARSAARWQPGNFRIELTGDASGNQACIARQPNMRIVNYAMFSSLACGKPFPPDTLAVTSVIWIGKTIRAADISFNSQYLWGIYNGPLFQPPFQGRHDFQRVAVHELGHSAGLNDEYSEVSSIMFWRESNVEVPSDADQQRLRTKYAGAPPQDPQEPYECNPSSPYPLKSDMGTLSTTTYRMGGCLDGKTRPETTFYFRLASNKRVRVGVKAELKEVIAEFRDSNSVLWQSPADGSLGKVSSFFDLRPNVEYAFRVLPRANGTTYWISIELQ